MNNKEFIGALSATTKLSEKKVQENVACLISTMLQVWQQGDAISINGFGTLEVKKKMERISVNPVSGKRMLIPQKLTLTYKNSDIFKEKINS
ncbi:MAG: HU family DNA-binding protein [Bacteroidaceae bacterium]|nr:HU family DNA-binding protein [Bacteroidaceae bacterium]